MAGWSPTKIGRSIGRPRCTITRGRQRNTSPHWDRYLDDYAQHQADHRRRAAGI